MLNIYENDYHLHYLILYRVYFFVNMLIDKNYHIIFKFYYIHVILRLGNINNFISSNLWIPIYLLPSLFQIYLLQYGNIHLGFYLDIFDDTPLLNNNFLEVILQLQLALYILFEVA